MGKDVEIEIKVQVEEITSLINFLREKARPEGVQRQIDEYFVPAHRDFVAIRPAKEWLRLRDSGGKYSINYKNWYYGNDGKTNHCDEYETRVDDIASLKKIFGALDIKSICVVDKERQIWVYKDFEIAIDQVKGLGNFVEVEYKGTGVNVDPKVITEKMVKFLKDCDCGKISRNYQGYPFLLLFPDEAKYESQ